jgi:hypothetical protein
MLAHHKGMIRNQYIPIFQKAVNEDPKLFIEVQAQMTAAMFAMCEAIVRFDTQLRNVSLFRSGQGRRKTDTDGGRRERVRKE